jgi:hypothetical protein
MRIGWGWKIAFLYGGFVALVLTLVIASNRQHFDLVTKDYYDAEIGYQKVIDAGKNQSTLSAPLLVHANTEAVTIDFPEEFRNKVLSGDIVFYAPVNSEWDKTFKINAQNNTVSILRSQLRNTRYTVKITCTVDGKSYYQESEIMLHS